MRQNLLIVANSVAIVASIAGYLMYLSQEWRGQPAPRVSRRQRVWRFGVISLVAAAVLAILSIRLTHDVVTLEQTGSLRNIGRGTPDVYYQIPYESPQNLEFSQQVRSDRFADRPEVVEQRRDGFKLRVDLDTWMYDWRASGVAKK